MASFVRSPGAWHLLMMTVLYVGQGFLQGLCVNLRLLLLGQRQVTYFETGALSNTLLTFSFKFLWAPVVDGVFFTQRTRRPLWIAATQVLLLCVFGAMSAGGSMLFDDPTWFATLVGLTYASSFISATQDVAVDAWAVEGVPASQGSYAATSQSIGLSIGIHLTQLATVLIEHRVVTVDDYLRGVFVVQLGISVAFTAYMRSRSCSTALEVASKTTATSKATESHHEEPTNLAGVLRQMRKVLQSEVCCRALCLVSFTSAITGAATGLAQQQLIIDGGAPAAYFADMSLALVPVSIATSVVASEWLRRRPESVAASWKNASLLAIATHVVSASIFPWLMEATVAEGGRPPLRAVVPLAVIQTIAGCVIFVAMTTMNGRCGRRNPQTSGTMLTLLASASNFGRSLPPTMAEWVLGAALMRAPTAAAGASPSEMVAVRTSRTAAFSMVCWGFIAVGMLAFGLLTLPALRRVRRRLATWEEQKAAGSMW